MASPARFTTTAVPDPRGMEARLADDTSPVAAVLPQVSMVDYPGRLCAVFFTSGCNFRCGFCHNAMLLQGRSQTFSWAGLRERARALRRLWADGAVITGGEPTLAPDLPRLVGELKALGFAVKLDTNGSRPDRLAELLPQVDYVALDVKTAPARYGRLTGFSDTAAIARSIALLREQAKAYELRTTVLLHEHDDACMDAIGEWVRGARRWVLQPFVPRPDLPDPSLRDALRTPSNRLMALRDRLRPYAMEILVRG